MSVRQMVMAKPLTAAFDPRTQVSALHVMWASDPDWSNPGDGNPVDSWRNHSGGGNPAALLGNRPNYRASIAGLNNRPTVSFARANSQRLYVDVTDIAQPFKVVVVFMLSTANVASTLIGRGGTNATHRIGLSTANWLMHFGTQQTGGTPDTTGHVMRATIDGSSSVLRIDEASVIAAGVGSGNLAALALGAGTADGVTFSNYLNGHIAFVGIYAGGTSDASLQTLVADLKTYYGTP